MTANNPSHIEVEGVQYRVVKDIEYEAIKALKNG